MAISLQATTARLRDGMSLPVLRKEMRSRMRGNRAPVLLFITTGLAMLVGLLILSTGWPDGYGNDAASAARQMAQLGQALFVGLMIVEGILCILIAPALTAGAVTLEREHQTLEMLFLTRLSHSGIVIGKLLSSLSFLVIMLLCSLPVLAVSFLLGGVDPGQLLQMLALILSTALLFGAMGIYWSTRFPRTASAVTLAYFCSLAWLGAIPLLVGITASTTIYEPHLTRLGLWLYGLLIGTAAILPTVLIAAVGSLFTRFTPLARTRWLWLPTLLLWAGLTAAGIGYFLHAHVHQLLHNQGNGEYLFAGLLGNPIVAAILVTVDETQGGFPLPKLVPYFVPSALGLQLLLAAALVILASARLRWIRNQER